MHRLVWLSLVVLALTLPMLSAASIYTDQINFEPNISRSHSQVITADTPTTITVILDPAFTLTGTNPAASQSGNNVTWSGVSQAQFNMTSPTTCGEGDVYRMPVYISGTLFSSFTFICIPDEKIVDYKAEYGHGDANYLDDSYRFLPASDVSLFNLIRVYTYGSYLNPNEDAINASITCYFPDYLVMTRQKNEGTDIVHGDTGVNATFYWTSLFGNWFRVAPLEQEITGLVAGDTYNISCDELAYYYSTGRVRADFENVSFQIRSTTPLNVTASVNADNNGLLYYITNDELYPIYDLEFLWTTDTDESYYEKIEELLPGETVGFEVFLEGNGNLSLDASFVPVWYRTSLKPQRYSQAYIDSFNFDSGSSSIIKIGSISTSLNVPRVTLTHFPVLYTDNDYKAKAVLEVNGLPVDADSIPTLSIYYPNGTLYAEGNMTNENTGIYGYQFTVTELDALGIWLTEVNITYNSNLLNRYDYWELQSNPTQLEVRVDSRCDDEVCAEISITNEGTAPYEYVYYYWITDDPNAAYNSTNTTDRGHASKLINPGDTYIIEKCLTHPDTETTHYFKAMTYFGEYAYAMDSYTNGLACRDTHGAGGGAGRVERAAEILPPGFVEVRPNWIALILAGLVILYLWTKLRKVKRETHYREPWLVALEGEEEEKTT